MLIINPKRINESIEVKPFWYNYYAGYSHTFTQNIIESANLPDEAVILDPWNGAGTTTLMASVNGYQSIGIDLNPVMKIIAMAKQAIKDDAILVEERIKEVNANIKVTINSKDPLFTWFEINGVKSIRKIEKFILDGLEYSSTLDKANFMSASQCLMYTALFNCVREYLSWFIPTNPTWIKRPKKETEKLSVSWSGFKRRYLDLLREMIDGVAILEHFWSPKLSQILVGSSTNLPINSSSVDFVLTSPPYCTRIDYGVATFPELAILCVEGNYEIDSIRRGLMGTTTVPKFVDGVLSNLGTQCVAFLEGVKSHDSKASKTYYFKNFVQYFQSLNYSIDEIDRILKDNARFVCVVQDSYYKDLHCDLPKLVIEMAETKGLTLVENIQFESKKNMANLNLKARQYRKKSTAFENVLIFEKA